MSSQEPIYAPGGHAAQPVSDEYEKLNELAKERQKEQDERDKKQGEIEAARAEAEAREHELQQEIEWLLSSDPREFVIRFLQTEGQ